jgi:hypothetical protein
MLADGVLAVADSGRRDEPLGCHGTLPPSFCPWFRVSEITDLWWSCGIIDFVARGVVNRVAIDVVDEGHQPLLEFVFRVEADVAQYRARQFGEEAFDDIEPRPVGGVKVKVKRSIGCAASQLVISREI